MAAPDITLATRFFPTGTTKYYWVPTIATKSAPSRAELNAGTNLSPDLAAVDGWQVESALIDTPDISTRFVSQIAGRITAPSSSITMYADAAGTDARTLMPRDTTGFIVRLDGGDVAGRKMDVFPVKVTSAPKALGTDDAAGTIQFTYAITSEPAENVTIPA